MDQLLVQDDKPVALESLIPEFACQMGSFPLSKFPSNIFAIDDEFTYVLIRRILVLFTDLTSTGLERANRVINRILEQN